MSQNFEIGTLSPPSTTDGVSEKVSREKTVNQNINICTLISAIKCHSRQGESSRFGSGSSQRLCRLVEDWCLGGSSPLSHIVGWLVDVFWLAGSLGCSSQESLGHMVVGDCPSLPH